MRLIDADALGIGKAKREAFTAPEYADGWNSAIDIIGAAPTIDIDRPTRSQFKRMAVKLGYEPVVHGTWMHKETEGGFHIWRCSRCGRGMNNNPEGIDLYCYHCGARMDGAE